MSRPSILLLDDNAEFAASLARGLRSGFEVRCVTTIGDAQAAMNESTELTLVDIVLDEKVPGDRSGLEFVEWAAREHADIPLVVLTGHGQDELEVEALRLGAADYIVKGALNFRLLRAKIEALLERRRERLRLKELRARLDEYEPHILIGESGPMKALRELVGQLAGSDATVFVTGESGSGKEVVARALHQSGPRRDAPFIAVNCAALSAGLLESEIFGHEKGAFTNAYERRIGAFEKADRGTLLLDEVTEIDVGLQAKLLRVLQDKQIQRVGSSDPIPVDVRIIATTNRNPEDVVRTGKLRKDLFYRLNVLRVEVPPLRQRPEDVPLLMRHFVERIRRRGASRVTAFSSAAIGLLQRYPWPGNVRELDNIVERACALCSQSEVPAVLVAPWLSGLEGGATGDSIAESDLDIGRRTAWAQLTALATALERTGGRKQEAQRLLGFADRSTMRRTIERLREDYPALWEQFPVVAANYGKTDRRRAARVAKRHP